MKTNIMKQKILAALFILFILACGAPATAQPTADVNATIAALQPSAMETAWAEVTINAPINTPLAADIPQPTNTPPPTIPPTSLPQPIILSGTGDSIIETGKTSDYVAILKAKHTGSSNFAILNYNANNEQIDVLVNTIGNYEGTVPLDFRSDELTSRLEIKADGPWEIQILSLFEARGEPIPGVIQGVGDDVVILAGTNPDTIKAAAEGNGNFAVVAFGDSGLDLVINEIAPYTGTVLLKNDVAVLAIQAEGNWSLEITTR